MRTAVLLLLVAIATSACAAATDMRPAASLGAGSALPAEVSVAEASALRDGGAFMLDVRETDEWVSGHIPDATLIQLSQLPSRLDEVPRDQPIVVVCRSGNRSAHGRDILRQAGFGDVTSMAGGMNDWIAAGLEVVTGP
jgi:rhodanese-related sulfurtransferase